jgi:hypothetical protein
MADECASEIYQRQFRLHFVSARQAEAAEPAAPTNKGQWQQVF